MTIPFIPTNLFPFATRPYDNVQPFTLRDSATMLNTIDGIRRWIQHDLIPHLDTEQSELVKSWAENIESINTAVVNALATNNTDVAAIVSEQNVKLSEFVTETNVLIGTMNGQVASATGSATAADASATNANSSAMAASESATDANTAAVEAAVSASNAEASANSVIPSTDAAMTAVVSDPDSDFSVHLTATNGFPVWATNAAPFNPVLNAYNLRPENTSKWRSARAKAMANFGQAHVSCFLDSITHGANTATANPKYVNAWPGRLARMLKVDMGDGGTGLVGMWDSLVPDGVTGKPPHDDRLKFAGAVTDVAYGTYNRSAKRVTGADGAVNYIEFTATCDEFWLYTVTSATGQPPRVQIDGGAIETIAGVSTALTPTHLPQPGYYGEAGSDTGNGQIVTKIPVAMGQHTIRLMAPATTGTLTVLNVEGRIAGKGVRVSNLAQSSRSMTDMILDDTVNHMHGLSVAVDMPRPDLTLLMLGMNDYQGHKAVATFKTQVALTIDRIRNGDTYGGHGDVILVTCPQPNYAAPIPGDGVLIPPLSSYYTALYELADEKNVPLIDVAQRWKDFTSSNNVGFFGDTLHPNTLGSEDIAVALKNVLMSV